MANFIEEFIYGNLDPQARSTKQNKAVQKQMEILLKNEEKLTAALNDENKRLFLDFANAWSVVNSESTLDSWPLSSFGLLLVRFVRKTLANLQKKY